MSSFFPVCFLEFLFHSLILSLKILSHSKLKLVNEDLLEGIEIILLIEDEHGFLVVNGINRTKA